MASTDPKNGTSTYPEIKFEDITIQKRIGVGSYGSVHVGLWKISSNVSKVVALKKVFALDNEAEILSKIRHRFIIEFYGVSQVNSDLYILTEYAENGSLYDYLHRDDCPEADFVRILSWASQICSALVYLHYDAVTTIIHRDLKSKNVVLDTKIQCKICDFGTSKDLTHSFTAPTWGGTAAWMSPEMIKQNEGITTATDVWSYGVVLWEMLSHEVPFKDFTEFQVYTQISEQGITLAIPNGCPTQLADVMYGCWKMNPKERFSMKTIKDKLEAMSKSTSIQKECQNFLDQENWTLVVENQKAEIEKLKKALEKNKTLLFAQEKALRKQSQQEVIRVFSERLPENVQLWTVYHTANWMTDILSKTLDEDDLNVVRKNIIKHNINGERLLELKLSQLENLGLSKIGSRIEVQKHIKILNENHNRALNFPTLHEAAMIDLNSKLRESVNLEKKSTYGLVLLLGFSSWRSGNVIRFKFYVDSDWEDVDETTNQSTYKMIRSACFSVFDQDTNRHINEPVCHSSNSSMISMDWVSKESHVNTVKVLANVHFADGVSEPRSAEMVAVVSHMEKNQILAERKVELKIVRRHKTSFSSSPSRTAPALRGAWQKKASETRHALNEAELASVNSALLTPPSSAETGKYTGDIFKPLSNGAYPGNMKANWTWRTKKKPNF